MYGLLYMPDFMNLYILSWISVRLITDPHRTWFVPSCVEITRRRTSLLYPSSSTGLRNTKTNWPRLSWLKSPRWTGRQRNDRGQILSHNAVLLLYRLSLSDRALIWNKFLYLYFVLCCRVGNASSKKDGISIEQILSHLDHMRQVCKNISCMCT